MEYSASYTGGGLLFEVTEALYSLIINPQRDKLLFKEAQENVFMKVNSESSRVRIIQEIKNRSRYATKAFWDIYSASSTKEKKLLLFYLCLKTYKLIYDFHFGVTVPQVLALETEVSNYRYRMRLDEIASTNMNVAKWSETTLKKVITSYIFMLESAGLSTGSILNKPDVSPSFFCYFVKAGELWALDAFFLKMHEKEKLIKDCNDD